MCLKAPLSTYQPKLDIVLEGKKEIKDTYFLENL